MSELFDPRRILTSTSCPEVFAHGPRMIERVDGGLVRIWLCQDQETGVLGRPPMFIPIVKVITPEANYIWNTMAHVEWSFDQGMLLQKPCGPAPLRPSRNVMM